MNKPSSRKSSLAIGLLALMSVSSPLQAQSAGDAVCARPARMIADQGWGDGYLAGINPAWTWSHAGYSISALGGWSHWPWWEKQRLPQFRGVGGTWNRLMPWFVISGPQGSRSPAHIQVGRMSVFYFSRSTQRWQLLAKDIRPEIGTCTANTALTDCRMTSSPAATAYSPNPLHGWFNFVSIPGDVQAISVSVQARLISGGRALMTVGADYYPPAHISMRGVAIPAAGNSAPKSLRNGWTTVTMTTLADQTNDNTGISRNALYRNAPACSNPAS
ncbi:hypothetical protein PPG32_07665 [Lautropia mirabilis]|uniref:hypothetical protein n=1 Tax=Lautropia mirabilis TaxID=47671 RepID=UPI00234935CE|nr:hypothetical protein [Lautropia mirabilis]MDC6093978.1 hypothetical protein [Lautropia mirabilis]